MEAHDELNPRQRQIDHVLRTRERQIAGAERELALMQEPWWAAKALIGALVKMSLATGPQDRTWRRYAAKPERVLHYLTGGNASSLISVGMVVDALDILTESGLVQRGIAGDYWWVAEKLPDEL